MPRPPPEHAPWTRRDLAILGALAAATLATRLALRTRGTFSVDSMLLALGVRSYDFAAYHPHPPYYPLAIAAAKLLAPWTGPTQALTGLSIASSLVMVAGVFAVARALAGRWAGAWAGALAILSPLALSNGVLPLSYAAEGAASALVAAIALEARRKPGPVAWVGLALAASVAVGLRASAASTAGPLVAWALARQWRGWAWTLATGFLGTLAWFVPAVVAGGGWDTFQYGLAYQSRVFIFSNPAWDGGAEAVRNNLAWLHHHLRQEWPVLLGAGALAVVTSTWPGRRSTPAGFLAVWILPSLLFYGFVYAGWPIFPSGYLMGLLPSLLVACAVVLRRLAGLVRDPVLDGGPRAVAAVAAVVLLVAPATWAAGWDGALRERDDVARYEASLDGLDLALPPETTAIVASYLGPWMVLEHPRHLTWIVETAVGEDGGARLQVEETRYGRSDKAFFDNLRDGPDDAPHAVPAWVERIAVLQGHPMEGDVPPLLTLEPDGTVRLPGGAELRVYDARRIATVESVVAHWGTVGPSTPPEGLVWPPP